MIKNHVGYIHTCIQYTSNVLAEGMVTAECIVCNPYPGTYRYAAMPVGATSGFLPFHGTAVVGLYVPQGQHNSSI